MNGFPHYLVVGWIPNLRGFVDFSKPLTTLLKSQKVSDDPSKPTYIDLRLELNENKEPSAIYVYDSETKELLVLFDVLYTTQSGFIYLLLKEKNPHLSFDDIKKTIYHKIKQFWHLDEYHASEEDSLLEAVIIPVKHWGEIYRVTRDRDSFKRILEHFIGNFYIYFDNQWELLSNFLPPNRYKERVNDLFEKLKKSKWMLSVNLPFQTNLEKKVKDIFWEFGKSKTLRIILYFFQPLTVYRYIYLSELEAKLNNLIGVYQYFIVLRDEFLRLTGEKNFEIEGIERLKEICLLRREGIRNRKALIVESVTIFALILAIIGLLPLIHLSMETVVGVLMAYTAFAVFYSIRRH